jgi:hypothetical protein
MRNRTSTAIILAMNRPLTASRALLVADRRVAPSEVRTAPLRRYRLARLRLEGREAPARIAFVKRAYY